MIFDYELMFVNDDANAKKDVTSGVLGGAIDLSGSEQGRGFPAMLAIAFNSDTTANADPDIQFGLETSATADFKDSTTLPLLLPLPVKKAALKAGTVLVSPLPKQGLKRYVRLKLGCDSAITCLGIKAGIVLDAPLQW